MRQERKCDALTNLFDNTKIDDLRSSSEDKRLYYLQVEAKAEVGYSRNKLASKKKKNTHLFKKQNCVRNSP